MTATKELLGNIKGPKGDTGDTGNGISSITEGTTTTSNGVTTTTYNVNFTNGNVGHFDVVHGEKGDQGIQGLTGPKGDSFAIEKTYATIAAMNADKNNIAEGKFVMITSANGAEDEDNAKLYVKGASDFTYITDLSGATGMAGTDGRGISSISKTATNGLTDTYTITYTDNETSTFTIVNGAKGDTGNTGKGISTIAKTGTNGLVDTYTVTMTDNTTTTFTVTNGATGQTGATGETGPQGEQGLIPFITIDSNGEAAGTGNLYVEYLTAAEYAQRTSNS